MQDRDRYLKITGLPEFDPKDEEELEDWADTAASYVTRYALSLPIFQELWCGVSTLGLRPVIAEVEAERYEELVSKVALALFPRSRYVSILEAELFHGREQNSSLQVHTWLRTRAARYLRLCMRRERTVGITDCRLYESVLASFPTSIQAELCKGGRKTIKSLFTEAPDLEESLKAHRRNKVEPLGAMAAEETPEQSQRSPAARPPPTPCRACNQLHWYKECPYRKSRCDHCQKIGHLKVACRNAVEKDYKGRVNVRLESKPGSTRLYARKDRTTGERVTTAEDVLQFLQQRIQRRSQKAKERRQLKNAGAPRKKSHKRSHPTALAQPAKKADSLSETSSSATSSSSESSEDSLAEVLHAYAAEPATHSEGWVRIPCIVNGKPTSAVADTGAVLTLCGTETAHRLGLTRTKTSRKFRGIGGTNSGFLSKPIIIRIGEKEMSTEISIVEQGDLPLLIGLDVLRALQLSVDSAGNTVFQRQTGGLVAVSWEEHKLITEKNDNFKVDTISGVDESLSDEQLLHKYKTDTFSVLTQHLPPSEQQQVWEVFKNRHECWLRPRGGEIHAIKASFEVEGPPIKQGIRPMSEEMRTELEKQVKDMLAKGVISPSKSPWGAPPVFVKKKTGEWRMCIDYRRLNKRMKGDAYPLPLIWDNLQLAAHHKYYTCLDCNWGFWNLPLDEKSKELTAFVSPLGSYQFNVLPFGIKNAPSEFQRAMDVVLSHLYQKGVLTYIDDIVIFTDTLEAHLERLAQVLDACAKQGLFLKLAKSEILKPEVTLLGHIVGRSGIRAHPKKIEAIMRATAPKTKPELRSFLGLSGYIRRFVPSYAAKVEPLTKLLKKNQEWEWNSEQEKAFQALKKEIEVSVMLAAPSLRGKSGYDRFALLTDASDVALGSALLLVSKSDFVVIEFASKTLTPAERKWSTREREAFAIHWAVKRFEDYLKGTHFFVLTDHESLRWMWKSTTGKVQRWALHLQQFAFDTIHLSGKINYMADYLSRCIPDAADDELLDEIACPSYWAGLSQHRALTVEEIKEAMKEENTEEEILKNITKGEDELYYHARSGKLYLPQALVHDVIHLFHTGPFGGHAGINRTARRINKFFWWPKLHRTVSEYVRSCLLCQRRQTRAEHPVLHGVLTRPAAFQLVSIDFVGPLQHNEQVWYYAVGIDHFSRFVQAVTSAGPDTNHAIRFLRDHWILPFGCPDCVLTDRGPAFRSSDFDKFCTQSIGAYHVYTSPYYPQGNGINEASHQSLDRALRAHLVYCQTEIPPRSSKEVFPEALSLAVAIHNATPHIGTGASPYELLYGQPLVLPHLQHFRHSPDPKATQLRREEARARDLVQQSLKTQRVTYLNGEKVEPGDFVIFLMSDYEKKLKGDSPDILDSNWSLPHRVIKVEDTVAFVVPIGSGPRAVPRQIPKRILQKLTCNYPEDLHEITMVQLTYRPPYRPWQRQRPPFKRPRRWSDVDRDLKMKEN